MGLNTLNELESLLADQSNEKNHDNIRKVLEDRKDQTHLQKMMLDQLIIQNRTTEQQNNRLKSINGIMIFFLIISILSVLGGILSVVGNS